VIVDDQLPVRLVATTDALDHDDAAGHASGRIDDERLRLLGLAADVAVFCDAEGLEPGGAPTNFTVPVSSPPSVTTISSYAAAGDDKSPIASARPAKSVRFI
jgi:hypothetical protein